MKSRLGEGNMRNQYSYVLTNASNQYAIEEVSMLARLQQYLQKACLLMSRCNIVKCIRRGRGIERISIDARPWRSIVFVLAK